MKKQEKWTPHIIAAAAFAVFIVLGLACATVPQEGTSTYLITRNPPAKETGYLAGKKAVIFNIGMANRGSAVANTKNNGNYLDIFQAAENVARIARAVSFNSTANKFDKENETDLKAILSIFDGILAAAWQRAYEAETVQVAYNFGNTTPRLNYFDRPNAALKSEIAGICAENDAEYAVSIIQQIDHGYLDEGYLVGTRKMAAITFIVARINVFDKDGNIVLSATAKFPGVASNTENGLIIGPNDGEQYAQLYLNSFGNILATIMAFDTSAAVSTDELLEGIVVQLATTEEVEEDK